jgi:hypothetical protein
MLRNIRLKHPIFHLLTMAAAKQLFQHGKILKLRNDQSLYREGTTARANIYFMLYGQIQLSHQSCGNFGETIGLGWTAGEDILFD